MYFGTTPLILGYYAFTGGRLLVFLQMTDESFLFLSMSEWGFIEQVLGGLQKNYFVRNIIQFEIFDYDFHQA